MRRLAACRADEILDDGVRLPLPVSPHLAARLNGSEINLDALVAIITAQPADQRWIIEGAGGVMVPLDGSQLMADLIARLGLATVVVARTALGTINHTLLTLDALRARAIRVAGVVMIGPPDTENRLAIEHYGRVQVVGELPILDPLTPRTLAPCAALLDPDGRVMEFLR